MYNRLKVRFHRAAEWQHSLRVGPKSSSTQTKLSEHETNRGEVEKSERVSGEIFEILGQPAAAIKPSESAFDGRPYNIDRLTFEWGSIIVRGSLCGRSKHRRHRDRRVSRFATGESESSGCLIAHPRLTSGSIGGGGADGPAHGSPSARGARFVRGDETWSPASDRGVRPPRAIDDASHNGKAEAQRCSDLASKDEDHDGEGR